MYAHYPPDRDKMTQGLRDSTVALLHFVATGLDISPEIHAMAWRRLFPSDPPPPATGPTPLLPPGSEGTPLICFTRFFAVFLCKCLTLCLSMAVCADVKSTMCSELGLIFNPLRALRRDTETDSIDAFGTSPLISSFLPDSPHVLLSRHCHLKRTTHDGYPYVLFFVCKQLHSLVSIFFCVPTVS